MVHKTSSKKRLAYFFIITIVLIGFSSRTASAAAKKAVTTTKKAPTAKTTKAAAPAKKAVAKTTTTKVKGEKVTANKISVVGDNTITTYKVKKGDTLSSIAQKFDISVNTIRWSNGISSKGTIKIGDSLTILPTSGIIYEVKSGDTLSEIAAKFAADQDDILNSNNLDNANSLKVGMKLAIPNVEPLDTDAAASATHDDTTLTENISPIAVPVVETNPVMQTPSVTPPVVSTPTTNEPAPGTTMVVTNPVTTDTYSITVIKPSTQETFTISPEDIRGYYAQPVSGRLSQGIHDVNAVDIATPIGTKVHAAADGTVIVAKNDGKYNGGYGNYMVISHPNNTQTLYAHLSKVTVALGEVVKQGEPIALSGNSGKVTGAHLHFEVRGGTNPWGSDSKGTTYSI